MPTSNRRVAPDDEIYQHDSIWVGPDHYTWPMQWTYTTWVIGGLNVLAWSTLLVALFAHDAESTLGMIFYALAGAVATTYIITRYIDKERPPRTVAEAIRNAAHAAWQHHAAHRATPRHTITATQVVIAPTPPTHQPPPTRETTDPPAAAHRPAADPWLRPGAHRQPQTTLTPTGHRPAAPGRAD